MDSDLVRRARAAAQHSREYGPGTNAPLLDELAAALEAEQRGRIVGSRAIDGVHVVVASAFTPGVEEQLLVRYDHYLAALEAAREDGWQPIETAPNGAWLLVHSERGWIGLARRSDPDYAPDEGWFEDEHTEYLDPAWLTHWRPLPAPPAIDQARGKEQETKG